jgi:hypothetical protein
MRLLELLIGRRRIASLMGTKVKEIFLLVGHIVDVLRERNHFSNTYLLLTIDLVGYILISRR